MGWILSGHTNGSLRERGRERGEGERVIPPPVTFRSNKISHTLKNGSKWLISGHTISPCGSPVSFRSSINSHIVKNGSLREREREGGEGERVVPPPLTFRSSKISLGLNGSLYEPTT